MPNMVDLYTPRTLAEVVKTTTPVRTFLRDRFFTNVKTFPTKRVDIDIVKGNRKMAAFIHPMVGGEIVQAEGYETKSYAPPLINPGHDQHRRPAVGAPARRRHVQWPHPGRPCRRKAD